MKNNLKKLRKQHNMTQEDLAYYIGASKRQIGAWERGENDLPMDFAYTAADIFNCSIDEVAGRDYYAVVELPDNAEVLLTDERELLGLYRRMETSQKLAFMEVARSMAVASEKDGAGNREHEKVAR